MWIDKLALVLLIIGGLNWGLVGVFSFDLVALALRRAGRRSQPYRRYTGRAVRSVGGISLLFRDTTAAEQA